MWSHLHTSSELGSIDIWLIAHLLPDAKHQVCCGFALAPHKRLQPHQALLSLHTAHDSGDSAVEEILVASANLTNEQHS